MPTPLRVSECGTLWHGTEQVEHPGVRSYCFRHLYLDPSQQRYVIMDRARRAVAVEIADTAYTVRTLVEDSSAGAIAILNDGTREPFQVTTVCSTLDGYFYCRVKGGHLARMLRPAIQAISPWIEGDVSGDFYLVKEGRSS
ncbi:MAG: hypothetical protein KDD44_09015, partial [Bdellovibrionales bacterium]|nr:hypothetical protein [Bdellovibrionales bacterium]